MEKAFWLFVGVIGFGLGYLVYPELHSIPQLSRTEFARYQNLKEAQLKLRALSESDYQEILKNPNLLERQKKSEELLAKIMQLFLIDLGTKTRPATPGGSTTESAPAPTDLTATQPPEKPVDTQAYPAPSTAEMKPTPPAQEIPKWLRASLRVKHAGTDQEADEALNDAVIPDLFDELKIAKPLSQLQLNLINGDYEGDIHFTDNRTPWHASWQVDGQIENHAVQGKMKIVLSKNGKAFSTSDGDDLKKFQSSASDPSAIFVNAYGDDGYMQLYPADRLNRLIGNFYLKEKIGSYKRVGIVTLEKVQ